MKHLLAILSLFVCSSAFAASVDRLPAGSSAPLFALPDVNGRRLPLEDLKGQAVVLNFWAFWCDTWKAEMPYLKELAARQKDLGFRLVAVSVDGTWLEEFQKRTGGKTPFPVLLDVGGKVSSEYRVGHVPTVVILDGAGHVRSTYIGYPGNAVVLSELRKLSSKDK